MSASKPRGSFAGVEVGELAKRLNERAADLAPILLPGGERHGDLYRAAKRSAGGLGDSFTVYLRTGKWRHFGGSIDGVEHGDMLDLMRLLQKKDLQGAIADALAYLGRTADEFKLAGTPADEAARRKAAAAAKEQNDERQKAARKAALAIFAQAEPLTMLDPAGRYLIGRGIDLAKLFRMRYGLRSLRFVPALRHPEANRDFPAMVAMCSHLDGQFATIHRTYLVERNGGWDRLRLDKDGVDGKMLYCAIGGAVCKLWRGERIDEKTGEVKCSFPWSDERSGPALTLCEGIEDALALAVARPGRRIAAAISLGNFAIVKLPERFSDVTWFADDDGDNSQAARLLDKALGRLEEQGRTVRVGKPPQGMKDANDVLKGAAA